MGFLNTVYIYYNSALEVTIAFFYNEEIYLKKYEKREVI